jgi:hypothetical protein
MAAGKGTNTSRDANTAHGCKDAWEARDKCTPQIHLKTKGKDEQKIEFKTKKEQQSEDTDNAVFRQSKIKNRNS